MGCAKPGHQAWAEAALRRYTPVMPRHVRLILIVTGGWIAACEAHAVGLSWLPIGPQKWLHLVAMGIGSALCLARAAIRRRDRLAWLLIGLGGVAWAVGEL